MVYPYRLYSLDLNILDGVNILDCCNFWFYFVYQSFLRGFFGEVIYFNPNLDEVGEEGLEGVILHPLSTFP